MNISKTQNIAWNGLSQQLLAKYAKELGVSESALNSFFKIIEAQHVPLKELDSKLHEIADSFQVLMLRLGAMYSEDPQVIRLKGHARRVLLTSCAYAQAEHLLNQAAACDLYAIEQVEDAARQHRLSAATTHADNAQLQRVQLCYAEAAEYFKKAAEILPLDHQYKQERADYLGKAGYDFHRAARYSAALALYEQSLAIRRDLDHKSGEGTLLPSTGKIYRVRGDNATTLQRYEQSLALSRKLGTKADEAVICWNIGGIYQEQNELSKAEEYISRTVQLDEEIGLPDLAEDREALERIRAQLQGL
jgi:tetratricopeptide (TPR) repeat protein